VGDFNNKIPLEVRLLPSGGFYKAQFEILHALRFILNSLAEMKTWALSGAK
jgi:hypothetical protein